MTAIKSRGNRSTELVMASLLRRSRIRGWRRHLRLLGSPDFAWRSEWVVLFVDGCFWHGCPRCYREPSTRVRYWRRKIGRNRERDQRNTRELRRQGWGVVRVWECQLKSEAKTRGALLRLLRELRRSKGS
jgi:DNA mismatch endonuclease (patch repair protein)